MVHGRSTLATQLSILVYANAFDTRNYYLVFYAQAFDIVGIKSYLSEG